MVTIDIVGVILDTKGLKETKRLKYCPKTGIKKTCSAIFSMFGPFKVPNNDCLLLTNL